MTDKKAPSKKLYGLAAIILIIGNIFLLMALYFSFIDENREFRFTLPGQTELESLEKGKYTIFYEYKSVIDGRVYSTTQNLSGLMISVQEKNTGEEIPLESKSTATYSINGREAVSVLTFNIENPGDYILTGWYEGTEAEEVVFTVQEGFVKTIVFSIIGVLVAFFSTLSSIILFILVFLKRRKNRNEIHNV